ncbi:hypothetical protein HID58_093746, partial [Brassica napus]
MSHRYSREDKKKWISTRDQLSRKPPAQIPEIDTTVLIDENKFTLIGRVTNPAVQNTKALRWNLLMKTCRNTASDVTLLAMKKMPALWWRILGSVTEVLTGLVPLKRISLDENRRKYEERRNGKSNQNRQMRESSSTFSKRNYYEDRRTDSRHNSRRNQSYEPFTSEYRRGREDYILGRSFSRESGARAEINPRNSVFPSKTAEAHDRVRANSNRRLEERRAPSHDSVLQAPTLPAPIPHSTDLRRALSRRDEGEVSAEQVSSGRRPIKERLMLADNPHSTDLRRSL